MTRTLSASHIWLMASAVLAALSALSGEASGEELGGVLTSKFNLANELGVVALLGGAFAVLVRPRLALLACSLGAALILPLQTWRIVPGVWCLVGTCSMSYPTIVLNGPACIALLMSGLAFLLAARMPAR